MVLPACTLDCEKWREDMVYFGTLVTSRVDTFFHFSNSEVYVCVCVCVTVASLFSNVAICHILVIHVCVRQLKQVNSQSPPLTFLFCIRPFSVYHCSHLCNHCRNRISMSTLKTSTYQSIPSSFSITIILLHIILYRDSLGTLCYMYVSMYRYHSI